MSSVLNWRPSPKAQELVARVGELSAPAPTVVSLISLLNRADVDQPAVEQAVERDPVLSAKLLALANSAYFGLARPASSLREVLFYLGHTEVYRLAIAVSLSGILSRKALAYAMDEGQLWRHSLLTAKCAEMLAASSKSGEVDGSTAYTAGLLHDIGKIIFNQVLPADTQRLLAVALETGEEAGIAAEQKLLGTDHAEAGACLLQQWKLPVSIVTAVASHESLRSDAAFDLLSVVYFANSIAHCAENSSPSEAKELAQEAERIGLTGDSMERVIARSSELLPHFEHLSAL
jgi:putative nucleotidyltransferase with HDIG domain